MVLRIQLTKLTGFCCMAMLLGACASSTTSNNSQQSHDDMYAALTDDQIQYRDGEGTNQNRPVADKDMVQQQVTEIRSLYFRRDYASATEKAERLLRLEPNSAEAYYWLARIHMDQADYTQAYNMATKGITVTDNPNLKRELERVQSQAQMGNY